MRFEKKYAALTANDRVKLNEAVIGRWKAALKRLLISLALPLICLGAILIFVNLPILKGRLRGEHISDFVLPIHEQGGVFIVFLIPASVILAIGNIVMFLRSIPPIYYDIIRNRKQLIEFKPEPYIVDGFDKYYVQTQIPLLPFLEVSYDQYTNLDYNSNCYLEVAPWTKIILGFKTIHSNNSIEETALMLNAE